MRVIVFILATILILSGPVAASSYRFTGLFEPAARPGSSAIFDALAGGTFSGTYTVPAGSFPGIPGTAIPLPTFTVEARAPDGTVLFDFRDGGQDTSGFFFDFFGPGSGDGFLFTRPDGVRFQIGVTTGFTGWSTIEHDALFSLGTVYTGGIDVLSGTATVPLPAALGLLLGGLLGLGAIRIRR